MLRQLERPKGAQRITDQRAPVRLIDAVAQRGFCALDGLLDLLLEAYSRPNRAAAVSNARGARTDQVLVGRDLVGEDATDIHGTAAHPVQRDGDAMPARRARRMDHDAGLAVRLRQLERLGPSRSRHEKPE